MSVGWIGVVEVVEESRNGCIAWMADLLLKAEVDRDDDDEVEVEGPAFGFDVEGVSVVLLRSWTFIDATEPGIRLASVGALRKVEPSASAAAAAAGAALAGGFAAMACNGECGEG